MKIPVIKGRIGSWIYYVGTMTMGQIASTQVSASVDEIYKATCLQNLLQRNLTRNYESIKEYLLKEKDRFFNAIILAIFDGDPQWLEVEFKGDEREFNNVGFLEFTGKEKIFPVDGQHRVKGIKEAVKTNKSLLFESVPVIFIAHDNSDDGKKKTRKLFSTLNRRAKPVGQEENIALDEDDICSIITRDLIQNIPLFQGENLTIKGGKPVSSSNTEAFTSIITLYQCVESIVKWQLKKEGITASKYKDYILYRKDDATIEKYKGIVFDIMEAFIKETSVIQKYLSDSSNKRASCFRNAEGGNLIFRPVALTEYINAAIELIESGFTYKEAFEQLDKLPQDIALKPWAGLLWDGTKMRVRISKPAIKYLLVYMCDKNLLEQKDYEKLILIYSTTLNIDKEEAEQIIQNL
ncbi:MAG: DGQHR domain-containing protein [Clostridia bacterium]|nr:DGQHR domain-containing protein [Clostridia bacterium]